MRVCGMNVTYTVGVNAARDAVPLLFVICPPISARRRKDVTSLWRPTPKGVFVLGFLHTAAEEPSRAEMQLLNLVRDFASRGFEDQQQHTKDMARELQDPQQRYALVSWPSVIALKAAAKAATRTGQSALSVEHLQYGQKASSGRDPLRNIKRPILASNECLVLFRAFLQDEQSASATWLYKMPFEGDALEPAVNKLGGLVNDDQSFIFYQQGRCSHCGSKPEELFTCTGCHSSGYCGKACQKDGWMQHKPLCKHLQKLYAAS